MILWTRTGDSLSAYDRLTGGFNCQLVKVNSRASSRQFISLLRNLENMKLESLAFYDVRNG